MMWQPPGPGTCVDFQDVAVEHAHSQMLPVALRCINMHETTYSYIIITDQQYIKDFVVVPKSVIMDTRITYMIIIGRPRYHVQYIIITCCVHAAAVARR